jgi:predicted N-formylglutamate amidohydrolase
MMHEQHEFFIVKELATTKVDESKIPFVFSLSSMTGVIRGMKRRVCVCVWMRLDKHY